MFAQLMRHCSHVRNASHCRAELLSRRQFSVIASHTSFPATLYRFQTQRSSGLSDYKQSSDLEDGLELSADGLVRPRVSRSIPFSNGAAFMPNTFTMQEWVRRNYDDFAESLGEDQSPSGTVILSVGKGTSIPGLLTLHHERLSRFSLQPSRPMSVKELNDLLSDFYLRNATFTDAEEWMERNEYSESISDDEIERWTNQ